MNDESMLAMVVVGYLVILACIIFVRRNDGVTYNVLDKFSVVLNFIICLLVVPFVLCIVDFSQIFMTGEELVFQINTCVPVISAFAVAASLILRRKGLSKSGFFVQFIGPVIFVLTLVFEQFSV